MICFNCSSKEAVTFLEESITCSHCNEVNVISYHVCNKCGSMWKAIDGKIVPEASFSDLEFSNFITDAFDITNSSSDSVGTMNEVVHRCLKCNTIAFEFGPNAFHCPECGFEWETA